MDILMMCEIYMQAPGAIDWEEQKYSMDIDRLVAQKKAMYGLEDE